MRIVCDTGPLLHLREAGLLQLLQPSGRIVIPPTVHLELIVQDPLWERNLPAWVEVEKLAPGSAETAARWVRAGLLDPGEAEALSLAVQMDADWFLTDDTAARLIAIQQGLEVHGSIGVVLWAATAGHLDQTTAETALTTLARSSLWISSRVLEEARMALRQIFA